MKESSKNFAVGLTVIMGLVLVAGIILVFTGLPGCLAQGYRIEVRMDNSHGIIEGDIIHMRGIEVGRVTNIGFTEGDPESVTLIATIGDEYRLPANTRLVIQGANFLGRPYLNLESSGEPLIGPDGEPLEWIPPGAQIEGIFRQADMIPQEVKTQLSTIANLGEMIGPAMQEFSALARNLNLLLGGTPATPNGGQANGGNGNGNGNGQAPPESPLQSTLAKFDTVLTGMAAFFGNEQNQKNLSQALQGMADASSAAQKSFAQIDSLLSELKELAAQGQKTVASIGQTSDVAQEQVKRVAERMVTSVEQLSQVLQTLQLASRKLERGEGTAGKILNDPELYNNLVDAAGELNKLVTEMRGLVQEWKESGLGIKLR